jgi:hypothetical protein
MVSMAPNTQRYDYTYTYTNLCDKQKPTEDFTGTIYDLLVKDNRFTKTVKIIDTGLLKNVLAIPPNRNGLTLFVTLDDNIPDHYMNSLDTFKAQTLINSYLLPGVASKEYLLQNGSAVYMPRKYHYNNPMIIEVNDAKEILVNKVGQLKETISATNGYIHVLDNLADVSYIN